MRRFAAILLCVAAFVPVGSARGADPVMRVHFIDVGQGAATLVELPCAALLIDTGGERWPAEAWKPVKYDSTAALTRYLDDFFAGRPDLDRSLSLLWLTHPHKDHTRGVSEVIARYRPKNVVHNGQKHGSGVDEQDEARSYAKEEAEVGGWYVLDRKVEESDDGLSNDVIDPLKNCQGVDPRIRALWGQVGNDAGWYDEDFGDENNHSAIVRIDFGAASILFTGDLEEAAESGFDAGIERLVQRHAADRLLDVDVYHVGHHGSHNGTTDALVAAMSPKIAVIAAGPACKRDGFSAWQHAHPRVVTIEELERASSLGTREPKSVKVFRAWRTQPVTRQVARAIYSTGWDGTIVLSATAAGAWKVDRTTGPHACLAGN